MTPPAGVPSRAPRIPNAIRTDVEPMHFLQRPLWRSLPLVLALALACGPARADGPAEQLVTGPVLSLWKDPGNPLAFDLPSGRLFCATDVRLPAPDGGLGHILRDPDQRLMRALLRLAAGREWTFVVSTATPGLVVGVVDPDEGLVRGVLEPVGQGQGG